MPKKDVNLDTAQAAATKYLQAEFDRLLGNKERIESRGKRLAASSDFQYDLALFRGYIECASCFGVDVDNFRTSSALLS